MEAISRAYSSGPDEPSSASGGAIVKATSLEHPLVQMKIRNDEISGLNVSEEEKERLRQEALAECSQELDALRNEGSIR